MGCVGHRLAWRIPLGGRKYNLASYTGCPQSLQQMLAANSRTLHSQTPLHPAYLQLEALAFLQIRLSSGHDTHFHLRAKNLLGCAVQNQSRLVCHLHLPLHGGLVPASCLTRLTSSTLASICMSLAAWSVDLFKQDIHMPINLGGCAHE